LRERRSRAIDAGPSEAAGDERQMVAVVAAAALGAFTADEVVVGCGGEDGYEWQRRLVAVGAGRYWTSQACAASLNWVPSHGQRLIVADGADGGHGRR
jgi:hypothetical protein